MKRSTPAVAYLRVSGKAQAGHDKDGLPRQREAVVKFAQRNGYEIVSEFRDEGISGTRELENRPALASLIDRIASNGVKVVIVENADRLARDSIVSELILRELAKHDARVITADGHELNGAERGTGKLVRKLLADIAEHDKDMLVDKLKAARQRKRSRGERVEGVKPYGHFPGERAAVDRMRELRRKPKKGARASFATIAARLTAEGYKTRSGKPWAARTIGKILARK